MTRFLLLFLATFSAQAAVISPSSVEVKFAYESEFQTAQLGPARDVVLGQARYLFSYLQNPEVGQQFGLDKRIGGVGAPRWEPQFTVLADQISGGVRTIRYAMSGLLLLHKKVAAELLARGTWDISPPLRPRPLLR